jgi:hypothetical protein
MKMEYHRPIATSQAKMVFDQELDAAHQLWLEHRNQWLEHCKTALVYLFPEAKANRPNAFWKGFSSFSISPKTSAARWIPVVPSCSEYESLYRDWLAVGSDLFTALRQDTILHKTSGQRTSDTAEPATTTTR